MTVWEKVSINHMIYSIFRGLYTSIEDDVRDKVKDFDLTISGFRILWTLYMDCKMSMTRLSYITQLNVSSVYRQVEKLEERNYVRVVIDEQDARTKDVELTEIGRKTIEDIIDHFSATINVTPLLEKLPEKDLEHFVRVSMFLCEELIGQDYIKWVEKTAANIIKQAQ